MREDETARSAAMRWFGIRGRAHGAAQTLTGVDLSSLIASVVHAVEAERWSGVRDVRPNETTTEAKHETNVTIDVDIATVIDRAVEREFMRAEQAEGRVHALETELAAVRKNLTDAHKELVATKKTSDRNFDLLGKVERQLIEAKDQNAKLEESLNDAIFDRNMAHGEADRAKKARLGMMLHLEVAERSLQSVREMPGGPVEVAKKEIDLALRVKP